MLCNGPLLGETPNTVTCHSADLQVQGKLVKQRDRLYPASSWEYTMKDANGFLLMSDCYDIIINNKQLLCNHGSPWWFRERYSLFKFICHFRFPRLINPPFSCFSWPRVYSHLNVLSHMNRHTHTHRHTLGIKRGGETTLGFIMFSFPSYLVIVCLRPENKTLLINSRLLGINAGSSPGK